MNDCGTALMLSDIKTPPVHAIANLTEICIVVACIVVAFVAFVIYENR